MKLNAPKHSQTTVSLANLQSRWMRAQRDRKRVDFNLNKIKNASNYYNNHQCISIIVKNQWLGKYKSSIINSVISSKNLQ